MEEAGGFICFVLALFKRNTSSVPVVVSSFCSELQPDFMLHLKGGISVCSCA